MKTLFLVKFVTVYLLALTLCITAKGESYTSNDQLYRITDAQQEPENSRVEEKSAYERKRDRINAYLNSSRQSPRTRSRRGRDTRQRRSENQRFSQRSNRWSDSSADLAPSQNQGGRSANGRYLSYQEAPQRQQPYRQPNSFQTQSAPIEGVNIGRQELIKVKQWLRGGGSNVNVASLSNPGENVARVEEDEEYGGLEDYQTKFHISLLGGLSQLESTAAQGTNGEPVPDNIYLGLQIDLSFWKFLGLELDGFYGIAPALETVTLDNSTGTETVGTSQSIQHTGVMGDLKLQLPLGTQDFKFVPKVGLGYGMNSLTASQSGGETSGETTADASGMYFVAGFDLIPSEKIKLSFDFANSFGGDSGETLVSQDLSSTVSTAGFTFSRLRIGASYRLFPKVALGTQFISRTFKGAEGTDSPKLTQILGLLMLEL